jgi:HD-like signal output (HDOD) protein
MRVLLVDDEPRVLEALERMVVELQDSWEISCAPGGREALELLRDNEFDVVVSDMRMPGMDGAELLGEVHRTHRHVMRFVLSGQTDRGSALRASRVAHQFLTKPCSAEILVDVIVRAQHLNARIASPEVRALVNGIERLPSVPALYRELQALIADDDANAASVAKVLSKDPAMTAKLLQLVNSGFFCRGARINDVRSAVVRLGLTVVSELVLLVGVFGSIDCSMSEAEVVSFQESAARAARVAHAIAKPEDAADASTAALLGDIGRLVLACRSTRPEAPAHEVRPNKAGAYLLEKWGLPQAIVTAVASLDDLRLDPGRKLGLSATVHAACRFVSGEPIDEAYFASMGSTELLAGWRKTASSIIGGH